MREILLNQLFPLITSLRKSEMTQLAEKNYTEAEKIRTIIQQFSEVRDKIITAQLKEISNANEQSLIIFTKVNEELSDYLKLKEKADSKLSSILTSLPVILSFLNSLIK